MKKNMQIALCCLVLCIFCNYVYAKPPVAVKITKGDARITALEGSSQAKCSGQKYARSLKVADVLQSGCEVSTGENSRLELILPDNSIILFAENTSFKLMQTDVSSAGQQNVKIFISLGKIWSNVRKALGGNGRVGIYY
jgi:hypothetical protein